MLERLFGYILYYNLGRPNEGLAMRTPVEVLQEKAPEISPDVAAFPPVILDRIDLSAAELLHPSAEEVGRMDPTLTSPAMPGAAP